MTTPEIINQTKKLIAIPSTADSPEELQKALEFVANIVARHKNITIERFERNGKPSFLAYRKGQRPKTFDILLNGHVDVVPAKPELFRAYEKEGKLYGRGALDMKATTLVLTNVFCELVNEVPYNLGLQVVTDEEIGGHNGVRLQIEQDVRANFVIMGEYANDRNVIYNAARGLCWAEIRFKGKSAHGGHLWHGSNAVVKAGEFAGAVLKRYPTPDKETWTTTASIANLSTPNDTYNKVPDSAILKIDFRFTQEDPVFQSRESLVDFIHELDPEAELVDTATFEPAVHVEELNPYVQGLAQAIEETTGIGAKFLGRPGASDGRHFALFNMDIIEFGPCGEGSHSNEEYLELNSLGEYQKILSTYLRKPIPDNLVKPKTLSSTPEPLHEALLRKLVAMPTVSRDLPANNKALEYIKHYLAARGMYVEQIEINGFRSIVATTTPGNRRPAVLLNAHIDVVPAPDKMFTLTLKDDTFYGRGVMDMKHAIAAYMAVVDSLKGNLTAYDFGIMITSDEEIGSNYGAKPLVEMGYRPKVVIIPDGGNNWELETFAKGVKWIRLDAAGKVAHASRPWEGDSAIRRLLDAIQEIEDLFPKNPSPKDTLFSIGTLQGGQAANQIPAEASAMLDIRTGNVADHKRLTPLIKKICKKYNVSADFQADEPPLESDPEHPLIKPFVDIVTTVTGKQHGTSYDFAVTDGRIFSTVGIPTIVMNPECGNIHREDEWLSRKGFSQFCQVIEQYVRTMANVPPTERHASQYVWYATFGSGLSKEHFLQSISGKQPHQTLRHNRGCTDTSEPLKDVFISLPYRLFFAGSCQFDDGGHAFIDYRQDDTAHTVARAYLITKEQFTEIASQENKQSIVKQLPFKAAATHGHAAIGYDSSDYGELLYCGTMDGCPIYSLTTSNPDVPPVAPSGAYTKLICKGLSEANHVDRKMAIEYLLSAPGLKGGRNEKLLRDSFTVNPTKRQV